MEKEIFGNLMSNRLLRNNNEIENYERNLELLSEDFSEEDILELCSTFDDQTNNSEVMFSAIHLLETLSSELAFIQTIEGVVEMYNNSPEWANIIVYRCLNDDFSIQMIINVLPQLEKKVVDQFTIVLERIKLEDVDRFGESIDKIMTALCK